MTLKLESVRSHDRRWSLRVLLDLLVWLRFPQLDGCNGVHRAVISSSEGD